MAVIGLRTVILHDFCPLHIFPSTGTECTLWSSTVDNVRLTFMFWSGTNAVVIMGSWQGVSWLSIGDLLGFLSVHSSNFMFYLLLFYLNSETFYLSSTKRERKVIKELSSGCLFLAFCFLPSHSLAMLILHSVDDFIGTTDFPSFSSFRK